MWMIYCTHTSWTNRTRLYGHWHITIHHTRHRRVIIIIIELSYCNKAKDIKIDKKPVKRRREGMCLLLKEQWAEFEKSSTFEFMFDPDCEFEKEKSSESSLCHISSSISDIDKSRLGSSADCDLVFLFFGGDWVVAVVVVEGAIEDGLHDVQKWDVILTTTYLWSTYMCTLYSKQPRCPLYT